MYVDYQVHLSSNPHLRSISILRIMPQLIEHSICSCLCIGKIDETASEHPARKTAEDKTTVRRYIQLKRKRTLEEKNKREAEEKARKEEIKTRLIALEQERRRNQASCSSTVAYVHNMWSSSPGVI